MCTFSHAQKKKFRLTEIIAFLSCSCSYKECLRQKEIVYSTATYGVQDVTAIGNGSGITVRGEFISDTLATGCFVVIQSNAENLDIYRALLRGDSEQTVCQY